MHKLGNLSHGLPWRTLGVVTLAVSLFLLPETIFEALLFDRQAIFSGELWRLLSGHLLHGDNNHLSLNLLAFLILSTIIEHSSPKQYWSTLLFSMTGVAVGLLLWSTELNYYCGLSGVLNSLLMIVLVDRWRMTANPLFIVIGIGAGIKVLIEMQTANAIFSNTSLMVVPESHLLGLVSGIVFVILSNQQSSSIRLQASQFNNELVQ